MPRKKEVSPEEKKTQELNKKQKLENSALKERKTTVERNRERKPLLLDRFGPKSKLDNINHSVYNEKDMSRYNAIKLPKPKGLTDEMIAMIAIGEAMNPKRLKGALTSSTVAGNLNQLSWNQSFIVENVISGDGRTRKFGAPLCEAKEETVSILNDYKKGKPERAQEALKRIIAYTADGLEVVRTDQGNSHPRKEMMRVINEMRKIPKLGIDNMLTDRDKARLTSLDQKIKAADKADETAVRLLEDMPEPDSPEREQLVFDYLFNSAVGSEGYNSDSEKAAEDEASEEVQKIADKYASLDKRSKGTGKGFISDCIMHDAFMVKDPHGAENTKLGKELVFGGDSLKLLKLKERFSPAEGLMAAHGNTDELKKLSEGAIRNSKLFKQLMKADSKLEMNKLLKKVPMNGFNSYPEVKIPDDMSKSFADKEFEARYEAEKKKLDEKFAEYSKSVYHDEYLMKFEGVEKEDILKNKQLKPEIIRTQRQLNFPKMYKQAEEDKPTIDAAPKQVEKDNEPPQVIKGADEAEVKLSSADGGFKKEYIKAPNDKSLESFDLAKYMKEQAGKASKLLDSDRFGHLDSKGIIQARSDVKAFQEAVRNCRTADIMEDKKVREALLKAYISTSGYKNEKKKEAGKAYDDEDFEPKSDMGKDRYKGAGIIETLAKKYISSEVAQVENERMEQRWLDTALKKGSNSSKYMKQAQDILKSTFRNNNKRRNSLADIEENAAAYSKELAQVIAANIVGKAYDKYSDSEELGEKIENGKRMYLTKRGYEKAYYDSIKCTRDDIMKRDDFKAMVRELTPEKALELGTSKDGKKLIMELSKTTKRLLANEKIQKEANAEKLFNMEIKRNKTL